MSCNGLFVGLTTLDCIYRVQSMPQSNEKVVAIASTIAAGGPATNAAVAFSHLGNDLGNEATVLSVIGCHPMRTLIADDLRECNVAIADLMPDYPASPPVSSIFVTASTGDRAVVSVNATKCQASVDLIPDWLLQLDTIDVVLMDGHQMAVSAAIAQVAQRENIPVIIDGGSWKEEFDSVLRHADVAICSANFRPPTCTTQDDVLDYLARLGIRHSAITQGDRPIYYQTLGESGYLAVSPIQPVDTLGAGDVFHGAFCHFLIDALHESKSSTSPIASASFISALRQASTVASQACQSFGTREWMKDKPDDSP